MRTKRAHRFGKWLLALGVFGTLASVAAMASLDVRALIAGATLRDHAAAHAPMYLGLRTGFVVIALGALARVHLASRRWRRTIVVALLVLACGMFVELAGLLAHGADGPWNGRTGGNGVEARLLRLAAMAAFAIPTLMLLAATDVGETRPADGTSPPHLVALLLRFEPALFAIGGATLSALLVCGALVHREITWLLPVGADTTLAGCCAAAIRAHGRRDRAACYGWLGVCSGMAIGLLMGAYAFGGPLPAPAFIGDYGALPRMLIRDAHILLISMGIVTIALAALRSGRGGVG